MDGRDVVPPDYSIALAGRNFEPGSRLAIYVDERAAEEVLVSPGGTFAAQVTAPRQVGAHRLTVRTVANGQIVDGANVMVVPGAGTEYPAGRKE